MTKKTAFKIPAIYCYVFLFSAAFLTRMIAAAASKGFGSDIACFAAWANRIYELGPGNFYTPDVFTDYPPGYMYVLYPIGALFSKLHLAYLGSAHQVLLKMPSILCDLLCGALILREGKSRFRPGQVCFLCAAYLFQPAVILNSSIWGQVDSLFTLLMLLMCLSLIRGKMLPAYAAFGLGLLVKPQTLFFGPVILIGFVEYVILKDFSVKKLLLNLGQILSVVSVMLLLCMPFGLSNVFSQYFSTVGSYPYASVNAYNFWALLGKSWSSQDSLLLGLPCVFWGCLLIIAVVVVTLFLGLRRRQDNTRYAFLCAFVLIGIFTFSVRMHERYLYPAMIFLLLAYVYRPSKQLLFCYLGFSLQHFCNTLHVFLFYDARNFDPAAPFILLASAGLLLMTVYLFVLTFRKKEGTKLELKTSSPRPSDSSFSLKRADWILLLLITALYSIFALCDLGDRKAPVTTMDMSENQVIELDFDGTVPATLRYYIAPWHGREFLLEERYYGEEQWHEGRQIMLDNVFTWQDAELKLSGSQVRFTLVSNQASLIEFTFLDADGNPLLPANAEDYPSLFDEAELCPERQSFRNSMYFDEIYHARTAYEFLNGLNSYENTHPPLGKIIISLGVAIFGMNPFGWRIAGTLFGIAMVPLSYLFARRLTRNTPAAALACILFSFDFMHFTQTRIATIDVYITFFVILMYYFMYQYSTLSFYDRPLKKTFLPLGACGISMGLGIACKWTGVYAGLGLAVIFFATLLRRWQEYRYAQKEPDAVSGGIRHSHIIESFPGNTVKTVLFCLVFFVAVPAVIYLLSYLPFRDYSENGLFLRMLNNQETMLSYHSGLNATHPYSSSWYEWPTIKRPIWYFSSIVTGSSGNGGLREGISAFGNPLVWWPGISAALYTVYLWIRKKDRIAAFLTVGYLAQYLPWFFVTRITFIYHYFPSVIFVVLMIVYCILKLFTKLGTKRFILLCSLYGAAVLLLFFLFYPVLSGQPVEADFVSRWLRWFDSWVLAAR